MRPETRSVCGEVEVVGAGVLANCTTPPFILAGSLDALLAQTPTSAKPFIFFFPGRTGTGRVNARWRFSTAWSQMPTGIGVRLGLVLGSTLLSPLTTPAACTRGWVAQGDSAEGLEWNWEGGAKLLAVWWCCHPGRLATAGCGRGAGSPEDSTVETNQLRKPADLELLEKKKKRGGSRFPRRATTLNRISWAVTLDWH